jgi:hypothetical protein
MKEAKPGADIKVGIVACSDHSTVN